MADQMLEVELRARVIELSRRIEVLEAAVVVNKHSLMPNTKHRRSCVRNSSVVIDDENDD